MLKEHRCKIIIFLIRIGRELWDMTNGYQKQPVLISKLAERLNCEESRIMEPLNIGEKIGLVKLEKEKNQIYIGTLGSACFTRS